MKSICAALVAGALLLTTPTIGFAAPPTPTAQPDNQQVQNYCYGLMASGDYPGLSLGECVSFNVTSEQGFVTKFCDFVRESDAYTDYGFDSYSDCVRSIR